MMHAAGTQTARGRVGTFSAVKEEGFGYKEARHLLLRAGFGGTYEQIHTLARWGPERAVDHLVGYGEIPNETDLGSAFLDDIIRPLSRTERQELTRARQMGDEDTVDRYRKERQKRQRQDRGQMRDIQRAWLTWMVQTARPLEEKMTLFWHGHFATSFRNVEDSWHMYSQNQMLRKNAMGNFGELLLGIVRDPAMLKYLNNNQNRKGSPNENFGRELLELFSLGEGNYGERDIKEAARTLTGYTFRDNDFYFNHNQHDKGNKRVLGAVGNYDGDALVKIILRQEACALFVCLKLYKFFVRDIPMDLSVVDLVTRKVLLQMAMMLRKGGYEIGPVVRKLLMSEHFYDSINMGTKIKSPCELLIGSVRSLGVPVRDIGVVSEAMDLMGQSLFLPPSVKGWDGGRNWINTSTLFVRQNTLIYLLTGALPTRPGFLRDSSYFDPLALVPSLNTPVESDSSDELIVRELMELTLGGGDESMVRSVVDGAVQGGTMRESEAVVRALVLLTSMPEYQLC
ncbi:MAG: DUF1800 domain-containing protein [Phycisphaerales bacterium]|nr:DUF1800 domain-containing protein [Phycisphaerales bacterium]